MPTLYRSANATSPPGTPQFYPTDYPTRPQPHRPTRLADLLNHHPTVRRHHRTPRPHWAWWAITITLLTTTILTAPHTPW